VLLGIALGALSVAGGGVTGLAVLLDRLDDRRYRRLYAGRTYRDFHTFLRR
jgi:hypothetical protein